MNKKKSIFVELAELRESLAKDVARFNSQAQWAVEHQVSPTYLSDVLTGRREPGKKILDALGMEAITVYRKKPTKQID